MRCFEVGINREVVVLRTVPDAMFARGRENPVEQFAFDFVLCRLVICAVCACAVQLWRVVGGLL